jgi:hypothetical protein
MSDRLRALATANEIEDTFDDLPQTSVSVPLLGECGTALEKILPVFRHQQFDLFEGLAA